MNHTFTSPSLWIIFLVSITLSSCRHDDGPETELATEVVLIERGTSSLVLEITSEADNTTIPVLLRLPAPGTSLSAVVVLHGSGGMWNDIDTNGDGIGDVCNVGVAPSSQTRAWGDLLTANNMIAAFPDSYSMRGTCENEGAYKEPPLKFIISGTFVRNGDAYATLNLLRKLVWADTRETIVDPTRIALIGFSDGGTAALATIYDTEKTPALWTWRQSFGSTQYTSEIKSPIARPEAGGFTCAVIYYAGAYHNGYYGSLCGTQGIYQSYCDVLYHLPANDPLTANAECLIQTAARNGGGEFHVVRYSNAGHSFDGTQEPESSNARTATINFIRAQFD